MKLPRICGCVILYHPEMYVFENILKLYSTVEEVFIVDNTEKRQVNDQLYNQLRELPKVSLISNLDNFGIAYALNQAAREASRQGYDFIVTLDQDSIVADGYVKKAFSVLQESNIEVSTIGIISPYHKTHPKIVNESSEAIVDKLVVMTSGNILSLRAFERTGEFLETLFIDRVDNEYCLRLKTKGYRIIQINSLILGHQLGSITIHSLCNKTYSTTNHSALRRYYQIRNMLYVMDMYKNNFPEYVQWERENLLRELKTIIFFEKNKMSKSWMMIRGYWDYRKKVFGKYCGKMI